MGVALLGALIGAPMAGAVPFMERAAPLIPGAMVGTARGERLFYAISRAQLEGDPPPKLQTPTQALSRPITIQFFGFPTQTLAKPVRNAPCAEATRRDRVALGT